MIEDSSRKDPKGRDAGWWLGAIDTDLFHQKVSKVHIALALYHIKEHRLFAPEFSSLKEFVEANMPGLSKSTAYRWADTVGKLTPSVFEELGAKTGFNESLFQRFALLPGEVQNAVVDGEKLTIDGVEYDFKNADKKDLRALIISLSERNMVLKKKYDASTRYENTNKDLEEKNAKLQRDLAAAQRNVSGDVAAALDVMAQERDAAIGIYSAFKDIKPVSLDPVVWADMMNTASFFNDLFAALLHILSNRFDVGEDHFPDDMLKSETAHLAKKYKPYWDGDGAPAAPEEDDGLNVDLDKPYINPRTH